MTSRRNKTDKKKLIFPVVVAFLWIRSSDASTGLSPDVDQTQLAGMPVGTVVLRIEWFLVAIAILVVALAIISYGLKRKVRNRLAMIEQQKVAIEQQNQRQKAILDELRETQDQLMQSEKMSSLGRMTSGIAHEINNPLNFISGGIQALEASVHELINMSAYHSQQKTSEIEAEVNSLLASIHKGVNRIGGIILSLKTFSSPQKDIQRVRIGEPLNMALEILQSKIKGAEVVVQKREELIAEVDGNSSELIQVFTNLIDNAIFAMQGRGIRTLAITVFRREAWVVIAFKDTGCGIPEEIGPKITDAFFTTKPEGEGTGLGLSISKRIIEKHNGNLSFTSEFGKGTTFEITLPLTLCQGGNHFC